MRPSLSIHAAVVCCALLAAAPAWATETQLPSMGSSAGTLATPQELRQYGYAVVHELRNQNMVQDDALLTDYVNTLGYRLVAHSPKPDQPFTFFVVRDPTINAFALPGGFIGVNSGLIEMTDNESELAAVLAHEISHVTQHHLIRAAEAEQKYAPLMVLAMVGAVIASAHQSPYSTGNTDVGAIATAQGLMQQMQINFTRADESEADRVGIQTLAKANFDPYAMADVFERMQQALRPGFDESDVPAMLMDHPVTTERISEAKARAAVLVKQMDATVTVSQVQPNGSEKKIASSSERVSVQDSNGTDDAKPTDFADPGSIMLPSWLRRSSTAAIQEMLNPGENLAVQRERSNAYFDLMRERARVLDSGQPTSTAAYYADNLRDDPAFNTVANRYGYVLALTQVGNAKKAQAEAAKLVSSDPHSLVLQLALGHADLMAGKREDALKIYSKLEQSYPQNRALVLDHARALLWSNDESSAKHALTLLRPQLSADDEDPELQVVFARACELAGDPVRASEAHADAAYLNGRAEDALNQLRRLAKKKSLTYYQRARVEARIAELTPIVLDLRRHKITPEQEDQGNGNQAGFGGTSVCVAGRCTPPTSSRNN